MSGGRFEFGPTWRPAFTAATISPGFRVDDGELTFIVPRPPNLKKEMSLGLLVLLGLMTAIMAGTYFYIRWVLKPAALAQERGRGSRRRQPGPPGSGEAIR